MDSERAGKTAKVLEQVLQDEDRQAEAIKQRCDGTSIPHLANIAHVRQVLVSQIAKIILANFWLGATRKTT